MLKKRENFARDITTQSTWIKSGGDYVSGYPSIGTLGPVIVKQVTDSTGHPVSLLGKTNLNIGGFFLTTKQSYSERGGGPYDLYRKVGGLEYGSDGAYVYAQDLPKAPSFPVSATPSSVSDLGALGATAIARCLPTNPSADIATFIGELREGLPSLVGRKILKKPGVRSSAEEYINWEFGMRPLLSDLQKFGQTFLNQKKILEQLLRDSGRRVRRRYTFPDEVSEVTTSTSNFSRPSYHTYLYNGRGVITTTTKTTTKRWFSGAFSYHLPEGESLLARMQAFEAQANKLVGLPSVETMWNLTPWSWAADWFANLGDILHNLVAFSRDGLVMHYGYMMEHKTIVRTVTYAGSMYIGNVPTSITSTQIFTSESKIRIAASPFGFGLTEADLSLRQKAIAVALGITHMPSLK